MLRNSSGIWHVSFSTPVKRRIRGEGAGAKDEDRVAERLRRDAVNRGDVAQGTARRTWVCTAGSCHFCTRLACGVVVSHESAQLFQPWDVPTAYPLAERGLPPRGP
jgi:hypothetical protein